MLRIYHTHVIRVYPITSPTIPTYSSHRTHIEDLPTNSSHHTRVEDLHLEVVVLRGEWVGRDVNPNAPVFICRIAGK